MRALLCLDGTNAERLTQQAFALLTMNDLRIVLLHVVDVGPGQEMERMRQRFIGMGQRGAELLAQMARAEQEQGEEILTAAQAARRGADGERGAARQARTGDCAPERRTLD